MNGVHDMGGMAGMGPIGPETDEPVFHARWEARVFALSLAAGAWGRWTIDAARHSRELIPAADYLGMSYYERWLAGLEALLVKAGMVSRGEIEAGRAAPGGAKVAPALTVEMAASGPQRSSRQAAEVSAPTRFFVGDEVRARNIHPAGHTRLPRYVRGRTGVVARDHGVFPLPDASAHGLGPRPQRLYGVRFSARELWGEAGRAGDAVFLDLWDSYLDPA